MGLTGKTAVVTGAGSGFGAGIARALAAAGARVMLGDADADAAAAVAQEIGGLSAGLDPLSNASVAALAYKAADQLGDIDIVVNAAPAPAPSGASQLLSEADFDTLLLAMAKPLYLTARHFLPAMLAAKSGVILTLVRAGPGQGAWADAANRWIAGATRSMAAELGAQGIRVNALSVLAETAPALPSFLGGKANGDRARHLSRVPLGRFGLPDDLGQAAVLLCSDAAGLVTGQVLAMDGGAGL